MDNEYDYYYDVVKDPFELVSDFALKSREDFGSDRATPLSRDTY